MTLKTLGSLTSLATVLFAAACARGAGDGTDTATGNLTAGTVCATLDYHHTVAPADFYRQFESDEKAADYFQKIIAQGKLAAESGPNATFQGITTDARILRIVNDIFEGYKKAFPRETEGMTTPPRVGIIKTDVVNAFAIAPGLTEDPSAPADKAPWVFVIHTALLDMGGTDNELAGIIGHELGHLILRTFLPDIRQHVRVIYKTGGSEDGILGAAQHDDSDVALHVEEILKRQDRVGGVAELGFNVVEGPRLPPPGSYLGFIDNLVAQAESAKAGSCATAKQKMADLKSAEQALLPNLAEGNYVPRTPTADETANLAKLEGAAVTELRACLPPIDGTLMELTAVVNHFSPDALDPQNADHQKLLDTMLDAEKQVDAENPTAPMGERILLAQEKIRAELVTLKADPKFPIDQLRIFDFEEDADDASVRVLSAIGQDPLGNGNMLLRLGVPEDRQEPCRQAVASDEPIPYGQFIDPHPATCWRYYHATQFAKALSQCTAASTGTTRPANGSGRASVIDKAPNEMIEKGYGVSGK